MNFQQFKKKFEKIPVEQYPNTVEMNPLVSICVQTYNHGPYIEECLDAILSQEVNFKYEILIGEDGSSDNTRELCIEYAKKYPDKIRLFLHTVENNIKVAGSRSGRFNYLYNLYASNGNYIAVCEGDDYWTDVHKLFKQVEVMKNNNDIILVTHGASKYNSTENQRIGLISICNTEGKVAPSKIITREEGYIPTASILFDKKMVKNLPDWFETTPVLDYYLSLLALKYGSIYNMNEVMCVRRIIEQSWTSKPKNNSWYINHHRYHLNSINSYDLFSNGTFTIELNKIVNTKTKEMFFGIIKNGIFNKFNKEDFHYLLKQSQYLKIVDYFSIIKKFAVNIIK